MVIHVHRHEVQKMVLFFVLLMTAFAADRTFAATDQSENPASVQLTSSWSYVTYAVKPGQTEEIVWYPLQSLNDSSLLQESKEKQFSTLKVELPDVNCMQCAISIPHYTRSFEMYLGNVRIFRWAG